MPVCVISTNQMAKPELDARGLALLNPIELFYRLRSTVRNIWSWYNIRAEFKKVGLKARLRDFVEQTKDTYIAFCQARAAGDDAALQDTVSDGFMIVSPSLVPTQAAIPLILIAPHMLAHEDRVEQTTAGRAHRVRDRRRVAQHQDAECPVYTAASG